MMRTRFSAVASCLALAVLLAVESAAALEYHVDTTTDAPDANPGDAVCASAAGACTLRAAIQEANLRPGQDTVILGPGSHVLSIPGADEDAAATGDLDVTDPLVIRGAGIGVTILDGGGLDRVLDVMPTTFVDSSIALQDLTVRGGVADAAGAGIRLYAWEETSIFERVELRDNEVKSSHVLAGSALDANGPCLIRDVSVVHNVGGAALALLDAAFTVERSVIAENDGAGIGRFDFFGPFLLADSIVRDNSGVGVRLAGEQFVEIRNAVIERNASGIDVGSDMDVSIRDSIVRNNAGVGIEASCGAICGVDIEGTTISGNLDGGILAECEAELGVRNSTISGNSAVRGGGVRLDDSFGCGVLIMTAANVTISDNVAGEGGGIAVDGYGTGGGWPPPPFVQLASTILAGNQAATGVDCVTSTAATIVSGGSNLVGSSTGCAWQPAIGDQVGSDASPIDAMLAPLAANGGATPTHALLPGSPAIDSIPAATCPIATDQRGVARPQGAACDVGAYEVTACADGVDQDGDGLADYPADPVCKDAASTREHAQCQDGVDNDGDGRIDFDGGASRNGGAPIASPDRPCANKPWRDSEKSSCGLGGELVLVIGSIARLTRRTRHP